MMNAERRKCEDTSRCNVKKACLLSDLFQVACAQSLTG